MALSASPPVQEELQKPAERQLRNQLAAAARSINWTYALFWSISSTQPGRMVLTWTDGFYNGEVKTRKINNSVELTTDQLVMQRSEQLRELYEALISGECDRRVARPVASLSPEDLGDTEWYYLVCMTYTFRPGQGLPGRSFASNEHVWLCNAHLAGTKTFPRALLAKTASIQSVVCIPLMGGVLELGTTDAVLRDAVLISRATAAFMDPQCPTYSEDPSWSANETGEATEDMVMFEATEDMVMLEDLDHNAMDMETITAAGAGRHREELAESESLFDASLPYITKDIAEFYTLCEEMDLQALEDGWIMDGSTFEVLSSPQPAPTRATTTAYVADTSSAPVDGSRATNSFMAWTTESSQSYSDQVPVNEEPQKLLKKVVAGGGAWANCGGGGTTTGTSQESGTKNHVMSERKRREKLNEMFLVLKSLVPSIHKVDKASILAETIAYLKELQRRLQELESSRELASRPSETTRPITRRHGNESLKKKVCAGSKRKNLCGDVEEEHEHPWILHKDGTSNVTVTVADKDVLLEVQCRWEELLMTRVFDTIKSLHLDVVSVQDSAPDGFMGLKILAQFAGSDAVVPWMISEALRRAIGKR